MPRRAGLGRLPVALLLFLALLATVVPPAVAGPVPPPPPAPARGASAGATTPVSAPADVLARVRRSPHVVAAREVRADEPGYRRVVAGGTHGTQLADLPAAQCRAAVARLRTWAGVR